MSFHVQCVLEKNNVRQTTWLPMKYAKVGKFVKLKESNEWIDGWKILETGTKMPSDYVNERSQDYKKTRKASDI